MLVETPISPTYSELITQAVADREATNGLAGPAAKAATALQFATTQPVFILSIRLSVGNTRVSLPWDTLRISPDLVAGLTQAGATCPTIDLFRGLAKRGTQLKTRKEAIQDKYLQSGGGFWFCREQDLPALAEEIAAMEQFAADLRNELAECYTDEFHGFLTRIASVLSAANIPTVDAQGIINRFSNLFPTLAQAQQGFGFVVDGPYRIPSILEQAQANNQVASELLQSQELQALAQLQAKQIQGLHAAVADCVAQAQDEIYGLIAEQLQRLESVDIAKITARSMRSAIDTVEQLQRKLDFSGSLSDLVAQVGDATQAVRRGSQADLQEALTAIKKRLAADLDQIQNTPKTGHKKLAAYMLG